MSKHTPGPWKAVYVGCGDWDLSGPTTQEDWTLAAAAPDLLEAAELALREAESWIRDQLEGTKFYENAMKELDPIRAAIAKATGADL